MKEGEMRRVAELFKEALMDKKEPDSIRREVNELRKDFRRVKYCFHESDAYEYRRLV